MSDEFRVWNSMAILLLGPVVLGLIWMFIQASRKRQKLSSAIIATALLTAGAICQIVSMNLRHKSKVLEIVLTVAQAVLIIIASWKLWGPLKQHLRENDLLPRK